MPRKMKRPSSPSPSCREIKKAKAASSSIDNNNDDVELSPDSEATEAPTTAHPIDTPMLTQPTAIEDPTMSCVVPSIPPVLVGPKKPTFLFFRKTRLFVFRKHSTFSFF